MTNSPQMRSAIFLDRDGTINEDHGYVFQPQDLAFEAGAVEGLRHLQDLGFLLIVVTNQSGIGRGYYTEEDFSLFMEEMKRRLAASGVYLDAVYFCPHHPEKAQGKYLQRCLCRKPEKGMIRQAVADFRNRGIEIDLQHSYVIGDKTADGRLGNVAGCQSILVLCPSGRQGQDQSHGCVWNYKADTLADAAKWIETQNTLWEA